MSSTTAKNLGLYGICLGVAAAGILILTFAKRRHYK
jgi:hypothetical protein